ncbi:MAG: hypothetical protein JWL81_1332 [Verrucomicrobiales bacterium]|nr:hypothetical protein [Verrucomicrobiales bacterium]
MSLLRSYNLSADYGYKDSTPPGSDAGYVIFKMLEILTAYYCYKDSTPLGLDAGYVISKML